MNRQRLVHFVSVAALAVALAACGSDGTSSNDTGSTDPGGTGPAGTDQGGSETLPSPDGYAHPTGPDDVVIEYTELSGFTTREYAFQQPPVVLISGDGRVFTTGPQIAIYPGPALPNIQVGTITEEAVQQLLSIADDKGLFAEIDYTEEPTLVADAPTATVTINVDGTSWVHSAYALGIDVPGETPSPERAALREFTAQLTDLAGTVGADQLGPVEAFGPERYLIQAVEVATPVTAADGLEPTIVDWPDTAEVALADATECAVVAADSVGDLFTNADQLTYFVDDGVTYQVVAVQQLPQRSCEN